MKEEINILSFNVVKKDVCGCLGKKKDLDNLSNDIVLE